MDIKFYDKLNEHEKLLYKKFQRAEEGKKQERNVTPLISPLNDMIEFNPFQYIPYAKLKAQKQYPKVVYIADEVGAGKTVETGIILTELLYNNELRTAEQKCLIICPNLLCRKWRYTLKLLFGINSVIVHSIEDIMNGINIISFDTVSSGDINKLKRIDMLIIDEAHNASGDRYDKIKEIRKKVNDEHGYVVLLSATPVSGDENDSRKQLEILFGSEKIDIEWKEFFKSSDKKHYLCKNKKHYMRYAFNPDRYKVKTNVTNHYVNNEVLNEFIKISKDLFTGTNTLMIFQGLNAIMSSPVAADLYFQKLLCKTEKELLEYLQSSHQNLYDEDDESEDEFEDEFVDYSIEDAKKIKEKIKEISEEIKKIVNDSSTDRKLEKLKSIIKENQQHFTNSEKQENKFFGHIIIFTDKLSTAKYLEKELKKEYEFVFRVTGELFESEKLNRLKQYKSVEEDISILIITNVACEGQDMDFGNTIINYDLDYNPVRLEQRRGRVDRFEVNKDEIYIHNFAVDGFDYNPEMPDKCCHQYSKVKKIFDKIQQIKETTGVFYEILQSAESTEDGELDSVVKNVCESVYGLISATDNAPSEIKELKEKLVQYILKTFGNEYIEYNDAYDIINEMMKEDGITINPADDKKVVITVDRKNQHFLNNVYYGGTLISHIISRGEYQ